MKQLWPRLQAVDRECAVDKCCNNIARNTQSKAGIIEAALSALFPLSAAATPCGLPLPKLSGSLEAFLAAL